jgi:phosphoribosylamine--glycine ligase
MKVLFISNDLLAGNLAYVLQKQGCDVKLYVKNIQQQENFTNLLQKTNDWRKELKWVGKNGLIIFDDIGFGKEQEKLRQKGYSVFGGCFIGDKLENDRAWAQSIFRKYGLAALPTYDFISIDLAINFVKEHPDSWVIKQNGTTSKSVNYVGQLDNGIDVISVLENYKRHGEDIGTVTLQKKALGVEIGIGRFFNGNDWVGPIEINIEHKKMFPGDLGPTTGEMGTLAWYDGEEKNKLFQLTLGKLKPFLKEINFRGDIDLGCIVNQKGIFPLEASPRFGSPIIHLQCELHKSPWFYFLKAVADGKRYNLRWKSGYGIVVMISTPPFPYVKKLKGISSYHTEIHFHKSINNSRFGKQIHFEEVSFDPNQKKYYISDHRGYILYVTSISKTIKDAANKTYKLVNKIHIPKMFYRNDIGSKFEKEDILKLRKWGYLK